MNSIASLCEFFHWEFCIEKHETLHQYENWDLYEFVSSLRNIRAFLSLVEKIWLQDWIVSIKCKERAIAYASECEIFSHRSFRTNSYTRLGQNVQWHRSPSIMVYEMLNGHCHWFVYFWGFSTHFLAKCLYIFLCPCHKWPGHLVLPMSILLQYPVFWTFLFFWSTLRYWIDFFGMQVCIDELQIELHSEFCSG